MNGTITLVLLLVGALCFGLVIGWVTYRTLRFSTVSGLSDIATVIGAVGGAAITALFQKESGAFGVYCIGLALGFFLYLRAAKDPNAPTWMGGGIGRNSDGNVGRGGRSEGGGLPGVIRD
jgi:NhaP-type Na+/H+ or K+/H+ antiporter